MFSEGCKRLVDEGLAKENGADNLLELGADSLAPGIEGSEMILDVVPELTNIFDR